MPMEDLQHIIPDGIKQSPRWLIYAILAAIILVLLIITVSLIGALASRHSSPTDTCVSIQCLDASAELLINMDNMVDPCDDFYQYACGGWLNRTTIPSSRSHISATAMLAERNYVRMRRLLETPTMGGESVNSAERKLKDFYSVCVRDYDRMKHAGGTMVDIINTHLGGWFVVNATEVTTNWDWRTALVTLHANYSVNVLIRLALTEDRWQRGKSVPVIHIGDLGMHFEVYVGDDYYTQARLAYKLYIRNAAKLILRDAGVQWSDDIGQRLDVFVEDVFDIEAAQARIISDNMDNEDWWDYQTKTLDDMQNDYSQINWVKLYKRMYDEDTISGSTRVHLAHEAYIRKLDDILKSHPDQARVMNNVLVWSLIDTYARDLSWDYRALKRQLLETIDGPRAVTSTWQRCVDTTLTYLSPILASLLLKDDSEDVSHSKALSLMGSIRGGLLERIDNHVTWMDDLTKQRAKKKLTKTSMIASFPHKFIGETKLNKLYEQMNINSSGRYLDNLVRVYRENIRLGHQALKTGHTDYVWMNFKQSIVFGVIPQFDSFDNELFLPVGALQYPLYSDMLPDFMNYAGVGVAIGKKLVKAVNLLGSKVLDNGTSGKWWSDHTRHKFTKTVNACLSTYYDSLNEMEFHVNGVKRTVKIEGSAQVPTAFNWIAGLNAAFHALKRHRNKHQLNRKLVGMDMSERQAFFVAHAQTVCNNRQNISAFMLARAQHIPSKILLNGALRNAKYFRDAFQCSSSSKMGSGAYCHVF